MNKNDKKFIIESLAGSLYYRNNIEDCYKKQKEIEKEFSELFLTAKKQSGTFKKSFDKSGKSTFVATYFEFTSGAGVQITCTDWSKELEWIDQLSVAIDTKEYGDFLQFEAF